MAKSPRRRSSSPRNKINKNQAQTGYVDHKFSELLDVATGVWWSMGTLAFSAVTEHRALYFVYFVDMVKEQFVCKECKEHFNAYVTEHPVQNEIFSNDQFISTGCFIWYWKAHNAVNTIKKSGSKTQVSYEDAVKFFSDQLEGKGCSTCLVNNSSQPTSEAKPPTQEIIMEPKSQPANLKHSNHKNSPFKISYTTF